VHLELSGTSRIEEECMNNFYSISDGRIVINLKDVIEIIKSNSDMERLTVKGDILDYLDLDDNWANRKLLTKATDELKRRGIIYTTFGINEEEPGYRGRGYMMSDPPIPLDE
jgi:hypothetical protein